MTDAPAWLPAHLVLWREICADLAWLKTVWQPTQWHPVPLQWAPAYPDDEPTKGVPVTPDSTQSVCDGNLFA